MSTYFHPKKYAPEDFASLAPSADALPVVIVGAGPVGMGVAMGLAQRGIPVTILEAADQVSFGSRAICVSRHSLEVAERLGFGAELEGTVLRGWVAGVTTAIRKSCTSGWHPPSTTRVAPWSTSRSPSSSRS